MINSIPARYVAAAASFAAGLALMFSPMAMGKPGVLGQRAGAYSAPVREAALVLRQHSQETQSAKAAARLFIAEGRGRGDASLIQAAETVLAPSLMAQPDAETLILAAIARQHLHDFPGSLQRLAEAERIQPYNSELLLTRANILIVQGRLDEARADCRKLASTMTLDLSMICSATVEMLSPNAARAAKRLEGFLALTPDMDPAMRAYAHSVLAEMAVYQAWPDQIEPNFQAALELDPANIRTAAIYADYLIAQGRPSEALAVLDQRPATDAVLVRRAIACKALARTTCVRRASIVLNAHLKAEMSRASAAHAREEARFLLDVRGDADLALERAVANFEIQREAEDADVLVRAAIAAGKPEAAEQVRAWMRQTGTEAPDLISLKILIQVSQ